jgi:predicted DNA-binding protein (MmcQ/YjbR family)
MLDGVTAAEPEDPRLARLSEICAALPEAERERHGRHAQFRVRGRTFAYFVDDHHGDGRVAMHAKAPDGAAAALVEAEPERFHRPAYLGHRGWIGLYLDAGEIDWDEVAGVVTESYVLVAPRRLAREVDATER